MDLTVEVASKRKNHVDAGGNPVIAVEFSLKGGMGSLHLYMSLAESKQYEAGDDVEYDLTLTPKAKAISPEREPLPASTNAPKP